MIFEKPKVEFVSLDMWSSIATTTSGGGSGCGQSDIGGGTSCSNDSPTKPNG